MLILLPIVLAVALESNGSHVILFGDAIDFPCAFKEKHGIPCGSCGLTRSWASSAEFRLEDAKFLNPYGPLSFGMYVFWSLSTIFILETYLRMRKKLLAFLLAIIGLSIFCFRVGFYPVYSLNSELLREYEEVQLEPKLCL